MPSLRSFFIKKGIKIAAKGVIKLEGKAMAEKRELLDAAARKWSNLPNDWTVKPFNIDEIYTEWISNHSSSEDKVILYLHGGGYQYCSADTHRSLAARIMNESGAKVILPEYRLAPEHPYPAALEDAVTVYRWLLNQGIHSSKIILAGDSAGGGLSVATTLFLRDHHEPLPAAVVCLSPWVDLTSSGESYTKNSETDPYLRVEDVREAALEYAGSEPLQNEYISPVFADFSGFPPLFIQAGSIEILQSDAEKLAKQARQAGVDVTIKIWPGMWHVWQISKKLREANKAIKEIGIFVKKTFRGA